MTPEFADRLGAARDARRLRRRLVKSDVEGSGIGRELARERRFFPRLGRGRFARRKAYSMRRSWATYLGASGCGGNSGRRGARVDLVTAVCGQLLARAA